MALIDIGDCHEYHRTLCPTKPPKKWQHQVLSSLEGVVLARWRKEIPSNYNQVVIASRQVGKNEVKARFELRLASLFQRSTRKATALTFAPTRMPQLNITKDRLKDIIESSPYLSMALQPTWHEWYQMKAGKFTLLLLSADKDANTAGHTATVVEQLDETQDILPSVFQKICQPMTAAEGAPIIFYGTEWNEDSLLHQQRLVAEERQRRTGVRLVHIIPWWVEAEENENYRDYVLGLIEELGEDHVMIRTHFCCEPAQSAGNLFSIDDIQFMIGTHSRQSERSHSGRFYVAGIDWCAAREEDTKESQESDVAYQGHDSTVVTIAECSFVWNKHTNEKMPVIRVVDQLAFEGREPYTLVDDVYNFVFNKWGCIKVVSDNTGVGNGPTGMLHSRRQFSVIPFDTTYQGKSMLGHHLVGAVKSGRLKMYRDDGSSDFRQTMIQFKECRRHELRANAMMKWGHPKQKVNGESIHDDYVLSMAYCYEAAKRHLASMGPVSSGATSLLEDCDWLQ